jgi:ArsR family transcriptional regulator
MPKDEELRAGPRSPGTSAFAALGDPTRRSILKMLRSGSKTAGEKPTLSHHFRVLRSAGLVRSERRGTSIVYTLQTNVLEDLATELYELASTTTSRSRARGPA